MKKMTGFDFNRTTARAERRALPRPATVRSGFTLIELLTVVAIIGLLAAFVLGAAGKASSAKTTSRVQSEVAGLVTAIERYHKEKGQYPPDTAVNGTNVNTIKNSLFYEITGNTLNATSDVFTSQLTGEVLPSATINGLFNVSGFINSAQIATDAKNYYTQLKTDKYLKINYTAGIVFTVFGTRANGPVGSMYPPASGSGALINPVHYVSSNPTNNHDSFDLWFDVLVSGKTNRFSNWSKDPEIVAY